MPSTSLMFLVWMQRISSGVLNTDINFQSDQIASKARSMELGLLVAAITTMLEQALRPYTRVRSWGTMWHLADTKALMNKLGHIVQFTHLFLLGSNGINLINEDDGGWIFFSFLECFPQIAFTLPSHFTHNLQSIDHKEECTSLICNGTCHQHFTSTERAEEKDTTRRFDTNWFE